MTWRPFDQWRFTAAPSRASAARKSSSAISGMVAAILAAAAASTAGAGEGGVRRSGAWRKRDALDSTPAEEAIDPLADHVGQMLNSRSQPGLRPAEPACPGQPRCSLGCRAGPARGHWILIGSLCAAISAPAISVQRVTSSADAKPCRVKLSPTTLPRRSRKRFGKAAAGLVHAEALCHPGDYERSSQGAEQKDFFRPFGERKQETAGARRVARLV